MHSTTKPPFASRSVHHRYQMASSYNCLLSTNEGFRAFLDQSVPEFDFVFSPVNQPLYYLAASFVPSPKLRWDLVELPLVEKLQKCAPVESCTSHIECEGCQSVKLILIDRDRDLVRNQ